MAKGIFDDDLLVDEESPADAGQGSDEQAAGPDEGQPAEGEASATEQAAQEKEAPQQEQARALTLEELEEQQKMENLRRKYGDNPDQMLKGLRELEKRLGQMGTEKDQLRQQLAMLQGYLQALPHLMGQQAPQAMQAVQQQAKAEPDEHEKLLQDFESMYPGITKAFEKRYERLVGQRVSEIEKKVTETLAPVQQFMTQEYFNRQALQLAAKYQDFKELAQDMMQVYQEQPTLAALPQGMEMAYQVAKARKMVAATQAAQAATEKQAARLPGSAGPRAAKPADPEKEFLEQIFGSSGEPRGIFDDI